MSQGSIAEQLGQAKVLIQHAHFDEAERTLQGLLDQGLDAGSEREALYAMAVTQRYRKKPAEALKALDRLLTLEPEYGRAYQEKGYCFLAQQEWVLARECFLRAVEGNPALVPSWKALARLEEQVGKSSRARFAAAQEAFLKNLPRELLQAKDLFHEGKLLKAEQLCRRFLKAHPKDIEGMRQLAEIGVRLKVLDDAEFLLESCVAFVPEHLGARLDYLKLLNRKGKFAMALEQAETLLGEQPENPAFKLSMAAALSGLGRMKEATSLYRKCLDSQLDNKADVHVMLGHAQKADGKLEDAIASYRQAYRLRGDYGDAFWSLANTKTYRFTEDEIERLVAISKSETVSSNDKAHACFAAGKAFEDRKDFETSFAYYRRGNELKRQRSGYDPDKTAAMVDAQIEVCTRKLFEKRGSFGCEARDPILIVGLPRAGSTLLEQILASHSMVDGTMELHNILGLAQRLRGRSANEESQYPDILWKLDDSYFRRFGEQYIENTRVYREQAPFFIDKMPNNFLHIGLIRLILPNAKIIDARRHPMACGFSGYKQLFGEGQDFSYDMEWLGRYYKDYVRLMDHWDDVLPGYALRAQHEELVDDLEGQVRRLLDFCELPFEQNCIEFYKTKRSVRTPSSEQVRRPISRSGLEQWRNYEPWLGPMREALGEDVRQRYELAAVS